MKQNDNEVAKDEAVKELLGIAFSPIADWHNKWIKAKDFEALSPEHTVAIRSITTKTVKENVGTADVPVIAEVPYVKVKLHDKAKAFKLLCKLIGHDEALKMGLLLYTP